MKRYINKWIFLFVIPSLMLATGCKDYLTENAISLVTADSYVVDENGFEDLVRSCYPPLRDITTAVSARYFNLNGTDLFSSESWNDSLTSSGKVLEVYDTRLNSLLRSMGNGDDDNILYDYWNNLYVLVGRCNMAITRAPNITFTDEGLKDIRVAECKFLRALSFFYLVQQFGDVPMPLTETITASRAVTRVASADVYSQIISDLEECESILPVEADEYGRPTKGAAQFLLARVYLTRGWNFNNSLGGSDADFDKALQYADKIIAAYPLVADYTDLFPKSSKNPLTQVPDIGDAKNSEVVFAVQFSDDVLTYGGGNPYHSPFGGLSENFPGSTGRSSDYNRFQIIHLPTPTCYRLFDPKKDLRYKHNFNMVVYAMKDVTDFHYDLSDLSKTIDFHKGDTVIFYTNWDDPASGSDLCIDKGGSKVYDVLNMEDIASRDATAYTDAYPTPIFWKFWEPYIEYGDAGGTWDFALFRSAEAYLIAAEAIVKGATGGTLGGASVYYNKVLDRAVGEGVDPQCAADLADIYDTENKVSYRATEENIDIDMILDESARELMGELNRWNDLKRIGKLIERAKKYNPWTRSRGQISEKHLLRPIPQSEIDRSDPKIEQNPGY